MARARGEIVYLEIGSHLGGSIQPYLLDPRCRAVFSIDSRPASQPDDRAPGYRATYEGNSTARMLDHLRALDPRQAGKVVCFESEASEVDPARIVPRADVAFIDGEHTRRAVLADFAFCQRVLAPGGAVLFDDFPIVYPAVLEIVRSLRAAGAKFAGVRLDGKAFGLFFDRETVERDPFLVSCRRRSRLTLPRYGLKLLARKVFPRNTAKRRG